MNLPSTLRALYYILTFTYQLEVCNECCNITMSVGYSVSKAQWYVQLRYKSEVTYQVTIGLKGIGVEKIFLVHQNQVMLEQITVATQPGN